MANHTWWWNGSPSRCNYYHLHIVILCVVFSSVTWVMRSAVRAAHIRASQPSSQERRSCWTKIPWLMLRRRTTDNNISAINIKLLGISKQFWFWEKMFSNGWFEWASILSLLQFQVDWPMIWILFTYVHTVSVTESGRVGVNQNNTLSDPEGVFVIEGCQRIFNVIVSIRVTFIKSPWQLMAT